MKRQFFLNHGKGNEADVANVSVLQFKWSIWSPSKRTDNLQIRWQNGGHRRCGAVQSRTDSRKSVIKQSRQCHTGPEWKALAYRGITIGPFSLQDIPQLVLLLIDEQHLPDTQDSRHQERILRDRTCDGCHQTRRKCEMKVNRSPRTEKPAKHMQVSSQTGMDMQLRTRHNRFFLARVVHPTK